MTQEEVAILWKDANGWDVRGYKNTLEDLERFARLVAAKEREALANVATEDTSKERVVEIQKQRHEQEPVVGTKTWFEDGKVVTQYLHPSDIYTTPPQRTWVGLTDEDKKQMAKEANYHWEMTAGEYAERIGQLTEAKLKEKNT